jgi:hypothetical protein
MKRRSHFISSTHNRSSAGYSPRAGTATADFGEQLLQRARPSAFKKQKMVSLNYIATNTLGQNRSY